MPLSTILKVGVLIATATATVTDLGDGVSIRVKGTVQLQCGAGNSREVLFDTNGLSSTGKTIFDELCNSDDDVALLSTHEDDETKELEAVTDDATCRVESSITSHCKLDSVRCHHGRATCATGGCKDGYINREPASECVSEDGCTFQARRVAMSQDAQWIVQSVAPITIETQIAANQTRRERLVARLYQLDEMVGSWILVQDVLVPDRTITDDDYDMDRAFGVSVAICGALDNPDGLLRILVGDNSAELSNLQSSGEARVYTFQKSTGGLVLEQILHPATYSEFAYFGTGVALNRDCTTAVIGAPGIDSNRGSAMIYDLDRSIIAGQRFEGSTPIFMPSSVVEPFDLDGNLVETPNQFYGQALATNHDASLVFVGGYNTGVVYAYHKQTQDSYQLVQRISQPQSDAATVPNSTETSGAHSDSANTILTHGYSTTLACSCAGDVLVVGSPLSNDKAGEAYVFQSVGDEYKLQGTSSLLVSQGESSSNTLYGTEVDVNCAGTLVVIGGPGANTHNGVVDVYEREYEEAETTSDLEQAAQQSYRKAAVTKQRWNHIHTHIPATEVTERGTDRGFGMSASMDGNGNTIAVGSTYHSLNVFELALTSMSS